MNRSGRIALVVALGVGGLAAAAPARQQAKKGLKAAPAAQAATLPSHPSILTGLLPAQAVQTATPEQRLAQAKLVADGEHDPERALTLLTALASEAGVASEVRAQAFVAAARCLNQLGRGNEARAQLQAAAKLNGPGADEAKHLLDAGLTDQQLELRIAKAIEELFGSPPPPSANVSEYLSALRKNRTAGDLIWVGAPAVPRLVRVLADGDHLGNVTGAAYLLARINGDTAASAIRDAVKRPDPFYKRAILAGFPNSDGVGREPVRAAIMTLLQDPDPRVKQWVLAGARHLEKDSEILPLTRDADDAVRIEAWSALEGPRELDPQFEEELVKALRRCLTEDHDIVRRAAVDLFKKSTRVLERESGRALFLETLLDSSLTTTSADFSAEWVSSFQKVSHSFDRAISLDLIARVASSLGRCAHQEPDRWIEDGDVRHRALNFMVSMSKSAYSQPGEHIGWPAEERAKVWPLLRFGFGPSIWQWVAANATGDDYPTIAENCTVCGDVVTIQSAMIQATVARSPNPKPEVILSIAQRQAIAKSVLPLFESDLAAPEAGKLQWGARLGMIANILIKLGVEEGDRALVHALAKMPDRNLVTPLVDRWDPPLTAPLLGDLVTIPVDFGHDTRLSRNDVLGRIAAAKAAELPSVLAKCYELGIKPSDSTNPKGKRPCGISWMLLRDLSLEDEAADGGRKSSGERSTSPAAARAGLAAEWNPSYSDAELRAAFEGCALRGVEPFWEDVLSAVRLIPDEGPFDPIASTLMGLAIRSAPAGNEKSLRARRTLVEELLRRRAPGWEEVAAANVLQPEVGEWFIGYAPEITPEMLKRVGEARGGNSSSNRKWLVQRLSSQHDESIRARAADFLRDPDSGVREAAIPATLRGVPERGLDLVLLLATDPSSGVRAALCANLESVFDRRVVPILVDLLQDPQGNVRDAAKKSLDSIQYVFEQKEKWKRMLEGAGLDSANAAEALVKQAAGSQPKATRLVAIESLGTLGVAETLPVLITFMGEKDAEIAAAAKTAVEKINRRAAEKESAPAGKSPPAKGQ